MLADLSRKACSENTTMRVHKVFLEALERLLVQAFVRYNDNQYIVLQAEIVIKNLTQSYSSAELEDAIKNNKLPSL